MSRSEKKIRILFGINKLAIGGAERLMLSQLSHIDRARFAPHIVTLLPSTMPNFDAEARALGIPWEQFSFRSLLDIPELFRLYSFLHRGRFDVVVTNLFFTGIVLRIAAIFARVPIILVHEVNVSTQEDGKSILLEKLLARFTGRFVGVSNDVIAARSHALGIPKHRFILNYSAIDLDAIRAMRSNAQREKVRRSLGCGAEDLVIVTAGRLTEQKGQRYLIEAFASLRARHPTARLVIFGEGSLRTELEALTEKLGVHDAVSLPGAAPLSDIISVADIFVLPSLWEGLSVMLLEALAAELPIVATEVSGTKEVIKDGENGFLVSPYDSAALADKIALLISDPALRAKFGQASAKAVQKFSIESNLMTLSGVIDDVMREKHIRI